MLTPVTFTVGIPGIAYAQMEVYADIDKFGKTADILFLDPKGKMPLQRTIHLSFHPEDDVVSTIHFYDEATSKKVYYYDDEGELAEDIWTEKEEF